MWQFMTIFLLFNIIQINAVINPELENDIMSNDILSDLPPEEKNPLVSVYSNLIYTLKYPEDIELNSYIKFPKNEIEIVENKNNNITEDNPTTEYSINVSTQNNTEENYLVTQTEIDFNNMSWEERWNIIHENLKKFLTKHDLELILPDYIFRSRIVRLSLKNWIHNGTMVELKFYPDKKVDIDEDEKLPKEELQSLTRLKTMISDVFLIVWNFSCAAFDVIASIGFKLLIIPVGFLIVSFPILAIVKFVQYFFYGTSFFF